MHTTMVWALYYLLQLPSWHGSRLFHQFKHGFSLTRHSTDSCRYNPLLLLIERESVSVRVLFLYLGGYAHVGAVIIFHVGAMQNESLLLFFSVRLEMVIRLSLCQIDMLFVFFFLIFGINFNISKCYIEEVIFLFICFAFLA